MPHLVLLRKTCCTRFLVEACFGFLDLRRVIAQVGAKLVSKNDLCTEGHFNKCWSRAVANLHQGGAVNQMAGVLGTRSLAWTGERYVPEVGGTIAYEHLHRYAVAVGLVSGRSVLDIACGEGYGSWLLSDAAKTVVGVDLGFGHGRSRNGEIQKRQSGVQNRFVREGSFA